MKKLALAAGTAIALSLSAGAQAHPVNEGYITTTSDTVWRTGFGECWRNGFWDESVAIPEGCPGYQAPVAKAEPAPKPTYKMVPTEKQFHVLFDFDSATVKAGSLQETVKYLGSLSSLHSIQLTGSADPIGHSAYNQKLSERRVHAVETQLVNAGVAANKISTEAVGSTRANTQCKDAKSRISCLQPERRVTITINGEHKVKN